MDLHFTMNATIITTAPGQADYHLFENLPAYFYPEGVLERCPPSKVNAKFLEACYLLMDGPVPLGRVALYNNPHLNHEDRKTFCIGNYECNANGDDAKRLLDHVFAEAKKKGAEYLIGPMNGSTWDNYRFSLHHDHPEFLMEAHHHLYYNKQFIDSGFGIIAKYFSAIDRKMRHDRAGVLEREKELLAAGMKVRNIDLANYRQELERLYPFITHAFSTNFLYTPIEKEAFLEKYLEAQTFIDPDFVTIAENKTGEIIGVFFCVQDLLNRNEKHLIVKTIARHPGKEWAGLGHVMGNEITRRCVKKNFTGMIHAFLYEQGTSTTISKNFSGEVYKNYALYGKKL
ncbi:MAG TPA: hypothetical protein VI112_13970 [Bacteroidia bacterium]|jgi:hypothetical protein